MLDMLEANRQVVSKENRVSKIVGGTTTERVYDTDGPTKFSVRVPRQLEYCTTENLSTFIVANPHFNMLGSFKKPLVHATSFCNFWNLDQSCMVTRASRGWSSSLFLNCGAE